MADQWPPSLKAPDASLANPVTAAAPTADSKENPYSKLGFASVTSVVNLDTGPMSNRREDKSAWQIMSEKME